MRVERDRLIWPVYQAAGLFKTRGVEDILRTYLDKGRASTWDGALIDFHWASLHEVVPRINQHNHRNSTFESAWRTDSAERLRESLLAVHHQNPPEPSTFDVQLKISEQFIWEPVSPSILENFGLPVARALEVMLLRAYEALKSTDKLMQYPVIEHRVTLALAQEALILWKKFRSEPASVGLFEQQFLFGKLKELEETEQWQRKTFPEVDPHLLTARAATEVMLRNLGIEPNDPEAKRRLKALIRQFKWQEMVILDPDEMGAFGEKAKFRYQDVFGDRDIAAHSLPPCWDAYVRVEDGKLNRVCAPTNTPSPPHYMAMFVWSDFLDALRVMRDSMKTDYALWCRALYAPKLNETIALE